MTQRIRRRHALAGICLGLVLGVAPAARGAEGYPPDYTPSKPAEDGATNVLARLGAIADYMNSKLEAAGGNDSPACYRNCMTVAYNGLLSCLESYHTYATSESCEQSSASKMAACDPKCT